jgi:rhamnosyl/mannosyltransferase
MSVIMPTSRRYLETSELLAPHRDRCRVVPLGLPLEDYAPTDQTLRLTSEYRERWGEYVFFIGVLRYYKGLNVLIEAMRRLPGRRLIIAGAGPEEKALRAQAAELADRVQFVGAVDHPTAVGLFRAASVFCLPATERSEAFGLCQIEAMACGLPVVSTNLPTGVPEINRHEETGLIVPPNDPTALASALERLFGDAPLRNRFADAARRRAFEHYTAARMADQVRAAYRSVLDRESALSRGLP